MLTNITTSSTDTNSSFATRLISSISRRVRLHRQASQSTLIMDEEEYDDDFQSFHTNETGITCKSDTSDWYYCDNCKIGYGTLTRHHWHTSVCNLNFSNNNSNKNSN